MACKSSRETSRVMEGIEKSLKTTLTGENRTALEIARLQCR